MADKSKRNLAPIAFFKQTGRGRSIRVYQNNEVVYLQGSPAKAVFYINSGMVKLTVESKRSRKKAVLAVLHEGDIFGEGCLAGRQPQQMSTARSLGQSTITRVEKRNFLNKIDRDSAFAAMFTEHLLSQIARFKADLADHFLNSSERRLARILLMYRGFTQKSKGEPPTLRFNQRILAELVGTTRSRVNSFMNEFREKGYIRYNGNLEIDYKQLTAFLED
jgi:CRP-like cAMP-binding protein